MAIDIGTLRGQLDSMAQRAAHKERVEQWATNTLQSIPDEILPRVPAGARPALERLAKLCESIGPRILDTRAFGTLGDVNWGGGDAKAKGQAAATEEVDESLADIDLEALAAEFLVQAQVKGIMAGIVRRDAEDQDAVFMEPLLGHLELIYAEGSSQHVVGLSQAWLELDQKATGTDRTKWCLRIYDIKERRIQEWRGLKTLAGALKATPQLIERSPEYPDGAPVPRFIVIKKHPRTYQPLGELDVLLPLIQSDWSSQLRGDRAEENTAFPQLKLVGQVADGTNERSSAHIIRLAQGGDAAFLDPGDLSQLHTHHDRKLERIREDGSMPGAFVGGSTPSGEAIREQNQKFIASCQFYSERLARLLSALAEDLVLALGLKLSATPTVSVQINREFTKQSEIETVVLLYDKSLIPLSAAVRAISVFLPTWTDKEVEEFILEETKPLTSRAPLPTQLLPGEDDEETNPALN